MGNFQRPRAYGLARWRHTPLRIAATVSALSLLLAGCGTQPVAVPSPKRPPASPVVKHPPTTLQDAGTLFSPTTGLPERTHRDRLLAVIIENSPSARPQTGLQNADIVYEMEAEGTITRYLAIFHDDIPSSIGPVRSARPYFVETASSWQAPFIHFGGSPEAYAMLKNYPYQQIDGIFTSQLYFLRDPSRVAPHNAYLLPDKLPAMPVHTHNDHFAFGVDPSFLAAPKVSRLHIQYNDFTDIDYQYNAKTQRYERMLDGSPYVDRASGKQIYANNVIVQYSHMALIPQDPKGRITIDLQSGGPCMYFTGGKELQGRWIAKNGQIVYLDLDGKTILLHPGKTWIEVVDHTVLVQPGV